MGKSKRRTYSAEFKLDTVLEGLRGKKSIAQICRERGIKDNQYYNLREIFIERSAEIFADQRKLRDQEKEERIAELERMIGRLTIENDILKKAKSWLE